jgi:hypothetical protein
MFERAIQELGWKTPDRRSAAARYARCVSQLILKGEVTPYDGARGVWEACLAVRDTSFHDLAPFIYAGSEYRDRPKVRAMKTESLVSTGCPTTVPKRYPLTRLGLAFEQTESSPHVPPQRLTFHAVPRRLFRLFHIVGGGDRSRHRANGTEPSSRCSLLNRHFRIDPIS